jgi:hypothetical protein
MSTHKPEAIIQSIESIAVSLERLAADLRDLTTTAPMTDDDLRSLASQAHLNARRIELASKRVGLYAAMQS